MVRHKGLKQILLLALFVLIGIVRAQIWLLPSPLMNIVIEDLNISLSQGGMLLLIVTLFMGIFQFASSPVIDRFGSERAMAVAMACFSFDGVILSITSDYYIIMIGRALSGIGWGFSTTSMAALTSAWFKQSHLGLVNGFNAATSGLSMTLAYMLSVPLYSAMDGWRPVMLLWSVCAMIITVLFILWMRKSQVKAPKNNKGTLHWSRSNSLIKSVCIKELWYLAIAQIGCIWIFNGFSTYLPTYLNTVNGLSMEASGSVAGIMTMVGIIGCVVTAPVMYFIKNKKKLLLVLLIMMLIGSLGTVTSLPGALLYIFAGLFGFSFFGWSPVLLTLVMDIENMTVEVIGSSVALVIGLPSLINVFLPPVFSQLQGIWGIKLTMLIFCMSLIISIFSILLYILHSRRRKIKNGGVI